MPDKEAGFIPGFVSGQDIFLAAHLHFGEVRPLDANLHISDDEKIEALQARLDEWPGCQESPVWWREPGIIGYPAASHCHATAARG